MSGTYATYLLLAEYLPDTHRNFGLTLYGGFWSLGIILEAFFAWVVITRYNKSWRFLVFVTAIPVAILSVLIFFVPESGKFYSSKGQKEKAMKTLELISKWNKKQFPEGVFVCDKDLSEESRVKRSNCEQLKNFQLFYLFSSWGLTRNTVCSLIIWSMSTFSYYGIGFLIPVFFEGLFSHVFHSFCSTFFKKTMTGILILLLLFQHSLNFLRYLSSRLLQSTSRKEK